MQGDSDGGAFDIDINRDIWVNRKSQPITSLFPSLYIESIRLENYPVFKH